MSAVTSIVRCELTGKPIETYIKEAEKVHKLPYLLAKQTSPDGKTTYFDGLSVLKKSESTYNTDSQILKSSVFFWFQKKRYCPRTAVTEFEHICTSTPLEASIHQLKRFSFDDGFLACVEHIKRLSKDIFDTDIHCKSNKEAKIDELYFWHRICLERNYEVFKHSHIYLYNSAIEDLIKVSLKIGFYSRCIKFILEVLEVSFEEENLAFLLYKILLNYKPMLGEETQKRISELFIKRASCLKDNLESQELPIKVVLVNLWNVLTGLIYTKEEKARATEELTALHKTVPDNKGIPFVLLKRAVSENNYSEVKMLSTELMSCGIKNYSYFAKQAYASMILFSKVIDEAELNNALDIITTACKERPEDIKSLLLLSRLVSRYIEKSSKPLRDTDIYISLIHHSICVGNVHPTLITTLAKLFDSKNRSENAINILKLYKTQLPLCVDIAQLLAKQYQKTAIEIPEHTELAIDCFKEVIELEPYSISANIEASRLLLQDSYITEGDVRYIAGCISRLKEKFSELDGKNQRVFYCLSALLHIKKEYFNLEIAKENLRKALTAVSTDDDFLKFTAKSIIEVQKLLNSCAAYMRYDFAI